MLNKLRIQDIKNFDDWNNGWGVLKKGTGAKDNNVNDLNFEIKEWTLVWHGTLDFGSRKRWITSTSSVTHGIDVKKKRKHLFDN